MKELSVEEKAKRYDEKLDVARHIYADPSVKEEDKYYIEVIFPELTESDDERIRIALMQNLKERFGTKGNMGEGLDMPDVLAWFEKQGKITNEWSEMKINNIQTELQEMVDLKQKTEQGEQKSADNIESSAFKDKLLELFQKFRYIKEGVPTNGDIIDYVDSHIQELIDTVQNKPWSEEDEKIIEEIINDIECARAINYHAPKEGYEFRENWLKSIKDRVQLQPKQECSEEDLYKVESALFGTYAADVASKLLNRLISLRPQNNITDEELAQAKKDAYNDALDKIEYHSGKPTFDDGWSAAIWYLKKRNAQPQNRWKPSDEQIDALWSATEKYLESDNEQVRKLRGEVLESLYEDLKKLKED